MADEQKKPDAEAEKTEATSKKPLWSRLLSKKVITTTIAVSVVVQGVGFLYYGLSGRGVHVAGGREVSLGDFKYEAPTGIQEGVLQAEFKLHVSLLAEMAAAGRARLNTRKYKVQQDIEELLRQAAQGDFEDPTLQELKRELQEKINQTLDKRVVAEVIITDLSVRRADAQVAAKQETSKADADKNVQWKEKEPS